ncbi:hypothetical protein RRG08_004213 [Elysia crispata]|uniref:Uncharacterized protein n=1 Tax=Elysia crispata TaxID=231223 RepID=A0AAE0ZL80_9GAST|nr:hypothetical protein RRG08_004213 [Elysia crispata]
MFGRAGWSGTIVDSRKEFYHPPETLLFFPIGTVFSHARISIAQIKVTHGDTIDPEVKIKLVLTDAFLLLTQLSEKEGFETEENSFTFKQLDSVRVFSTFRTEESVRLALISDARGAPVGRLQPGRIPLANETDQRARKQERIKPPELILEHPGDKTLPLTHFGLPNQKYLYRLLFAVNMARKLPSSVYQTLFLGTRFSYTAGNCHIRVHNE